MCGITLYTLLLLSIIYPIVMLFSVFYLTLPVIVSGLRHGDSPGIMWGSQYQMNSCSRIV